MTGRRLATSLVVAIGTLIWAGAAEAACTITTTAVNFGTYDVFSASADDATGLIRFRCTGPPTPSVTIQLDKGGAPSFTPRQLRMGGEILNYTLYLDSTRTTIWGDGTGGSQAYVQANPPNGGNIDLTVYGRIPPGQDVSAGTYSSTVTATIFF